MIKSLDCGMLARARSRSLFWDMNMWLSALHLHPAHPMYTCPALQGTKSHLQQAVVESFWQPEAETRSSKSGTIGVHATRRLLAMTTGCEALCFILADDTYFQSRTTRPFDVGTCRRNANVSRWWTKLINISSAASDGHLMFQYSRSRMERAMVYQQPARKKTAV